MQIRSDAAVGAINCCVPAGQLLTGLHAELELSFLKVVPFRHAVHTRSLVTDGIAVCPYPTPQFCTLIQLELALALNVVPEAQAWHTQFEMADAAATGCVPAGHTVIFLQYVCPV